MAKRDDFIYETGDETYVYDEPVKAGKSLASKAASIAIVATGLGIGMAFNPAAALFAQSTSDAKLSPQAAQPFGSDSQSPLTLPDETGSTGQTFTAESFSPSTNSAYQVPAQQFTAATGTPSSGNLSSATPTGSGAWSDDDDDDNDEDSHDREDHDDRDEDEDDD